MPQLLQFNASHYNEKARWTLDYKGVAHTRRTLLPGLHKRTLRRLTGQSMVPVLRADGEMIVGSARIVEYLERVYPEPALYPADAAQRERALEVQRFFDDEVGAEVRRARFFDLLEDPVYVARMFGMRAGAATLALYKAMWPFAKPVVMRDLDINEATASASRAATTRALDFLAEHAGTSGYLVGDRFSVADLAAASIMALTVLLPGTSMAMPEPLSPVEDVWFPRWAAHPGAQWVKCMFERHRGASAEVRS